MVTFACVRGHMRDSEFRQNQAFTEWHPATVPAVPSPWQQSLRSGTDSQGEERRRRLEKATQHPAICTQKFFSSRGHEQKSPKRTQNPVSRGLTEPEMRGLREPGSVAGPARAERIVDSGMKPSAAGMQLPDSPCNPKIKQNPGLSRVMAPHVDLSSLLDVSLNPVMPDA